MQYQHFCTVIYDINLYNHCTVARTSLVTKENMCKHTSLRPVRAAHAVLTRVHHPTLGSGWLCNRGNTLLMAPWRDLFSSEKSAKHVSLRLSIVCVF